MALRLRLPLLFHIVSASLLLFESQGKIVKYALDTFYFPDAPDGVSKDKILGINGLFPGPAIEANVGDTLEIVLNNEIKDGQNTTIHWHGIHHKGTWFDDGASQISQCPLPSGSFQTYRFNVTQPGTFWYHSHVNSQYTDGLFGPLIVHGDPELYEYDGELTLILSDWYHRTAHENEKWFLSPGSKGMSPFPDSVLINGLGRYPCDMARLQNRTCSRNAQFRPVFTVQHDAIYRLRVINSGAVASFNFSVDGHTLETIEVDGVDVARPVPVDVATIAPGQRYSFLIRREFHLKPGRYLIRASVLRDKLIIIEGQNINQYPNALINDVTAVLDRVDEDLGDETNLIIIKKEKFNHRKIVPPPIFSHPENAIKYLNEMELSPADGIRAPAVVDEEFNIVARSIVDEDGIRRATFNGTPFQLPHHSPLLMTLLEEGTIPETANPLEVQYGSVVQLVINHARNHPFHLHGHHFWVVGLGTPEDGSFDSSRHNLSLYGVKRDTVLVSSWAVIRFVAQNPGIWTFHCHTDWHNLGGMILTFVEAKDVLLKELEPTEEALRVCRLHGAYK